MKKLVLLALTVPAVVITGSFASAETVPPASGTINVASASLPMEYIDDIGVPIEVLLYIQDEYPGHAVTKVEQIDRNGQRAYRLLVGRDDVTTFSAESFYLLYDLNWHLINREEALPSPSSAPESEPQPTPESSAPSPQLQSEPEEATNPPEGGRGGEPLPDDDPVVEEAPPQEEAPANEELSADTVN